MIYFRWDSGNLPYGRACRVPKGIHDTTQDGLYRFYIVACQDIINVQLCRAIQLLTIVSRQHHPQGNGQLTFGSGPASGKSNAPTAYTYNFKLLQYFSFLFFFYLISHDGSLPYSQKRTEQNQRQMLHLSLAAQLVLLPTA